MVGIFKRKSEIEKRLKVIRKEISSVDSDLNSLSKKAVDPEKTSGRNSGGKYARSGADQRASGRFVDYFSTSFQPALPLRHERKIQRNKAIVMSVFVLVVLLWIVYRFFL